MIDALAETIDWAATRVALVRREHWELPTPCGDWTVRHLVNHMVGGNVMYAMGAEGAPPDAALVMSDLVGDDPVGAYRRSAQRAIAAWRGVDMGGTVSLPYGVIPASFSVRTHQMDHLLHSWDLCVALGVERQAPLHLVAATDAVLDVLPPEVIDNPRVFAAARTAPDDATAFDRLAARSGREVPG